jgi:hypothetical protein
MKDLYLHIYLYLENKMNQGKRKDQIEFSNMAAGVSMIAMIIIILLSWIWKIIS